MLVHIIDGPRRRHPLRLLDFRLTHQYWYPVVLARKYLADQGIQIRFFERPNNRALDCDVVLLSSRQHDYLFDTVKDPVARAQSVAALASCTAKLIWFDLRDSSGTPQFEVLPHVALYVKQMLLKDLGGYEANLYGGRIFADYYHRAFGVTDHSLEASDDQEEGFTSLMSCWAHKVVLGWDVSYDYRRHWISTGDQIRKSVEESIRLYKDSLPALDMHSPLAVRSLDLCAMFSVSRYSRNTVAYQRRLALEKVRSLRGSIVSSKVPRRDFLSNLRNSKIVLSCFGNGEVCYREHEAWISGAAVIMPNMSHIRTWPDRYRDGQTYRSIQWDLADLPEAYEQLVDEPQMRQRLAENGQSTMRNMFSEAGLRLFASRFMNIVQGKDPDLNFN